MSIIPVEEIIIRIVLSCFLGGLIGLERESVNRPAGFRTHILVCMGSTLVMLTGIFLFHSYKGLTDLDPARLGAQVISGIGFLGAGTILREGLSVKGLTTAASLWAVACIGLSIGSGFYIGAIISTVLVLIILFFFSKLEKYVSKKHNEVHINIIAVNKPGQLGKIGTELGNMDISILNIKLESIDEIMIEINIRTKIPRDINMSNVIDRLLKVEGIDNAELIK